MRRKEFSVSKEHEADVEQFINEMNYGILTVGNAEGYPIVKPLNYVYFNGAIYLHGSKAGEKMKALKKTDRAVFLICQDYSLIPSYLGDPYFACPATTFFKSVLIKGSILEVKDEPEKHEVLNVLMKKLQPEGGYSPIVYEDEQYHKQVKATAVLKLVIDEMTSKFKFGQNWNEQKQEKVKTFLTKRNDGLDIETVALMEKYCPYHKL